MAVFTFNIPLVKVFDYTNYTGGNVVSATATEIVISDSTNTERLVGSFAYDAFGNVSGTAAEYYFSEGAIVHVSVTGLTVDVNAWINGDTATKNILVFGGDDILNGASGEDILYSLAGDDRLFGNGGNDKLYSGTGNDAIFGGIGRDRLFGESGDDILKGGNGRDILKGGAGNDKLFGQGGRDILKGGNGKDTLNGGSGDDIMTGGGGADTFVFSTGDDTITDFNTSNNKEKIDLSGVAAIAGFKQLTNSYATEVAGDLIIDDGAGNTLTLTGIALSDLDRGDFIF